MHLAVRRCGYTLPGIGRRLSRDHTTVLHGLLLSQIADVESLVDDIVAGAEPPWPTAAGVTGADGVVPARVGGSAAQDEQVLRLYARGWSVNGLARRFERPPEEMAALVGIAFWDGEFVDRQVRL